jgi:hypothetical protein
MTQSQPVSTLDVKLDRIRQGTYTPADFVIADAKDGDMSMGVATPGFRLDADGRPTDVPRPLSDYRDGMRAVTRSGLVDIMLMSLSSAEVLTGEGLFADSPVTPAVRLNDASDIWAFRGAGYRASPAACFRTARIDRAREVADLGLYAVTFYNDLARDAATLEAYSAFRDEAEAGRMRHFLEVFNPAFPIDTGNVALGHYVNDAIARCLAGVARADRPLFLKMAYNGPRAMEELAAFDPGNLIVGILGGAAGTTRDTFELVAQAERHGARIALFGRKIYFAEDSVEIVAAMRRVVEGTQTPQDAVRDYHDRLATKGVRFARPLETDLEITEEVLR